MRKLSTPHYINHTGHEICLQPAALWWILYPSSDESRLQHSIRVESYPRRGNSDHDIIFIIYLTENFTCLKLSSQRALALINFFYFNQKIDNKKQGLIYDRLIHLNLNKSFLVIYLMLGNYS